MKSAIKYFFAWLGWMFLGALLMMFPAMIIGFAITGGHAVELFQNPWTFSLIIIGSQLLPIYVFWRTKYTNFGIHKSLNSVKLYLWMALAAIGVIFFNGIMESYLPFAEMEMEDLEFLYIMMKNPIGIVVILEDVNDILQAESVGVERRARITHGRQMNIAARGYQGGIELYAVLGALHKIGGAQQLCLSSHRQHGKRYH